VPRFTAAAAYGLVAWSFLVEVVGASVGASHWLLDTSVFHHVARAPAEDPGWLAAGILVAIGVAAAAIGAWRFSRQDLAGA
jgi:ABC-2 type transport system permease protein